jgi:single-strand DNA-binding protein
MANYNQLILLGNIGREIKIKDVNGISVANFSIATNESYGKADKKKVITTWFNVEAWDALAAIAEKILKPGATIFVTGKLRSDDYEKEGLKVKGFKLIADTIQVIDSLKSSETHEG